MTKGKKVSVIDDLLCPVLLRIDLFSMVTRPVVSLCVRHGDECE